ncbi:MAG: HAMP domain-containing methyl-accepting chemotaxis protein [Hyphomicrobiaceae bacterium]|nr:HAMP domain-containing methyl-accepting chemotaxis protein [Hyphomicrobiaceae bacterium]
MKLGSLLIASSVSLSTLGGALAAYIAAKQYQAMGRVAEAQSRLDVARAASDIPRYLNSERGFATNILYSPKAMEASQKAGLEKVRKLTTDARDKALSVRNALPASLDDRTAIAGTIEDINKRLEAVYKGIDAALTRPLEERREAAKAAIAGNVALNAVATRLINDQVRRMAVLDGEAFRQATFASAAWALRDAGGYSSSLHKNLLGFQRPATEAEKIDIARAMGRNDQIQASLLELRKDAGLDAGIATALDRMKEAYVERFGKMLETIRRDAATGNYQTNPEAFYRESQPALGTVVAVRDAFYSNAERVLDNAYANARNSLILALTGLVAVVGISAAVIVVVRRRVTTPIDALTGRMSALASGDIASEIPCTTRDDEIGAMARAVVVFRDAAADKLRMEGEAESARKLAMEERARAQEEAINAERAMVSRSIGQGMARLADKDLTFRLTDDLPEAYAQLQSDFNYAVSELEQALRGVANSGQSMGANTREISRSADDLSKRTEQQAAGLEQTAAAIDEITATGKKAAEGAEHAREVVATAKSDAEKTGEVVRKTVEAMGSIEKSAQKITQIIGVIDEIAFQTNLLALNAGVEAARAGDAGRGFAVVASEVRGLAQRSAEAAKEIKALIQTSSSQVAEGVDLVAATGTALERILAQVNEINSVVVDIASGAREQATGLQEVNTAINQMDQTTQQNAAMVEETTAASHALAQEAQLLGDLIGQFRMGGAAAAKASPVAPAARPRAPERLAPARAATAAQRKPAAAAVASEWEDF